MRTILLVALALAPSLAEAAPNCARSVKQTATWLPIHAMELNEEVKELREVISEAKGEFISGQHGGTLHKLSVLDAQAKVLEAIARQIELAATGLTSACVATTKSTFDDEEPSLAIAERGSGR